MIKKDPNKNVVAPNLSACAKERFNGFDIVKILQERKKKEFLLIDIVYQAVKNMMKQLIVVSQIPFIRRTE